MDKKTEQIPLKEALENLEKHMGMSKVDLARFDEASDHAYECNCDLCEDWWDLVGEESDE
jgi:hypothetical protein